MSDAVTIEACWPKIDEATQARVLDFWRREGVLGEEQMRKRVTEVATVALRGDEVVGVSTVRLAQSPRLGVPVWMFRCLVGSEARQQGLSGDLLLATRDCVGPWSQANPQASGLGLMCRFEAAAFNGSEGLRHPVSPKTSLVFVGVDKQGNHLRVAWFDHSRLPAPVPAPASGRGGEGTQN